MKMGYGVVLLCSAFSALAQTSVAPVSPTVPTKVMAEHTTHRVPAVYPPIARAAHVTGRVTVGVEIDAAGKLTQALVIDGPEMLRANAVEAVKQWTFSPVEIEGSPHAVRSAVFIDFRNLYKSTSE